jgi:hypothetical protein
MLRPAAATLLMGLAGWTACAPTLRYPTKTAAPPPVHELWQEPRALSKRDLFYGIGGKELAPNPKARFEFIGEDTTGASPGYTARDETDAEWDIKLGPEVQPEIVLSRLLWAIGYHQPPTYFVPAGWRISGAPRWVSIPGGPQSAGRFRPRQPNEKVTGDWSWYDNPFVGTRAFKGLVMANFMLSNMDFKSTNNKIYSVDPPIGDASRLFIVRDLGYALGKESPIFPNWLRWRAGRGSRNNIDDFEETGFIRRVNGDRVEFEYPGMDAALFENITPADVKWICGLFNRLTDSQWNDAFRAAGYSDDLRVRYITKIKQKIDQGVALGN